MSALCRDQLLTPPGAPGGHWEAASDDILDAFRNGRRGARWSVDSRGRLVVRQFESRHSRRETGQQSRVLLGVIRGRYKVQRLRADEQQAHATSLDTHALH